MKIYQLRTISNSRYAHIHAQMGQDVSMGKNIKVTWDNYLAKGNQMSDFCYSSYIICLRSIALDLISKYNGLAYIELLWDKNPLEIISKDKKRLKWLPQEDVDYVHLISTIEVPVLDASTVKYESSVINGKPCISEILGASEYSLSERKITERKNHMGLFIESASIENCDFFRPINTPILLCKESVRNDLINRQYTNLIFLEVGEVI